ncbi:MAG: DoxX family protein [Steroidobacteraceae bacterium]
MNTLTGTAGSAATELPTIGKAQVRIGWALSILTILFMLFDAAGKLALESHVLDATTKIGYPVAAIRPIGAIALLCTILYAVPRTAVLGAVLLTGFYGGAVASKIRIEDPLFSSILFGVYFGLIAWGGIYLRDARLRALFPFRR